MSNTSPPQAGSSRQPLGLSQSVPTLVTPQDPAAGTIPFPPISSSSGTVSPSVQREDPDRLTALSAQTRGRPSTRRIPSITQHNYGGSGSLKAGRDSAPSSSSLPVAVGRRSTESEPSSIGRPESASKRVSFEGERISLKSLQQVREALRMIHPSSDPVIPRDRAGNSRGESPARRGLWPLHRIHSREEPFVADDPYALKIEDLERNRDEVRQFIDQALRQFYRHAMLRLPSVYFTRVIRVFEDAEVSRPEVQRLIDRRNAGVPFPVNWTAPEVSPALARFKASWEEFIDTIMREWKNINLVSALLVSAILTMFQIEAASEQPIVRTAALLSLISALMSLVYGAIYILRFSSMRSIAKATRWAEEAEQSTSGIWWNIWVFLALPAVWLAWSLIFFFVCILAFVWTSGTGQPPTPLNSRSVLGPRIAITVVFAIGLLYFLLIIRTFRSYSDPVTLAQMSSPRLRATTREDEPPRFGMEERNGKRMPSPTPPHLQV